MKTFRKIIEITMLVVNALFLIAIWFVYFANNLPDSETIIQTMQIIMLWTPLIDVVATIILLSTESSLTTKRRTTKNGKNKR